MRVVRWVEHEIDAGHLAMGDKTPSVNAFRIMFSLSRSSVILAMKDLCSRGILQSQKAVGYYVRSKNISIREKVFLLFNELTFFKEDLYRSFLRSLGPDIHVDIAFHHYDRKVFETLLSDAAGNYTTYVVMPGKFTGLKPLLESIHSKVILLDHYAEDIRGCFPGVGQDFEKDTFDALMEGYQDIRKYNNIVLIQSKEIEPMERYYGIKRFAEENGFGHLLLSSIREMSLAPGTLYVTADDRELVMLLKRARQQRLKFGSDIGLLSYNETILKEVIADGIATLSTDFVLMGETLARLVMKPQSAGIEDIRNPWVLNRRASL